MMEYAPGDPIEVLDNNLTSTTITLLYSYYSILFCPPPGKLRSKPVNLGHLFTGERPFSTPFDLRMGRDASRNLLCIVNLANLQLREIKHIKYRIAEN